MTGAPDGPPMWCEPYEGETWASRDYFDGPLHQPWRRAVALLALSLAFVLPTLVWLPSAAVSGPVFAWLWHRCIDRAVGPRTERDWDPISIHMTWPRL